MADLRVRRVEFDSAQAANQPFPVRVKINNLETVGPAGWGPGVCPDGSVFTNNGHYADVSATVRDASGAEVFSETVQKCIPVNRPSELAGANAVVEFTPTLAPGEYTVQGRVEFRGESGDVHTSDPRQLTVGDDTSGLDEGDSSGGDNPWGIGDGDGDGSGLPDVPDLPNFEGIGTGALLALAVVAFVLVSSGDPFGG